MSEFDELLPPQPVRRRRTYEERERDRLAFYETFPGKQAIKRAGTGTTEIREAEFHMPVTQAFLARVFTMDPMTVNRRLRRLKPVGFGGTEKSPRPLYDFKQACEHLLKPRMDIETYLASLNPADMPNQVNKTFWEARRIKLKYEIEASDSWLTSDVLDTFGEVFMTIKNHTQLWVENMRAGSGLAPEQETKLATMVDLFLKDLHEKLLELPAKRQTKSRLSAIEQEMLSQTDSDDED